MTFLLDALAVYRLTRLAVEDGITQPVRDRIIEAAYTARGDAEEQRAAFAATIAGPGDAEFMFSEGDWQEIAESDPDPPKLAQLVVCPFCASVWVALGLVYVVRRRRFWPAMRDALALAGVVALWHEAKETAA